MLIPPLVAKFEAYGRSDIKPMDMITLDGQQMRIMNIQTHINKAENTYYQNIEGEWFFSIGVGKDQAPALMPAQPGTATHSSTPGESSTY
jgi:hypothetical protein